jgi:hypothetical protein
MNSGPKIVAELRDWNKLNVERDTFQGRIHNDISHQYVDGTFVTLEADNVAWNETGALVYVGAKIYVLWFIHQRKSKKDLLDEN